MEITITHSEVTRIARDITECRDCPRLVTWREKVAHDKRAAYADQTYWGRAVPSFGDPHASILVVGLAPAAHGANRTGRMFTGDRSGEWLYASLHRCGLANQATATGPDDGLELNGVYITATVHCAPPANRPTTVERDTCQRYLLRELEALRIMTVVALGGFAWDGFLRAARTAGVAVPRPKPRFSHGVEADVGPWRLLGCFHPSQQNTFTGKLTEPMLDDVFSRARTLTEGPKPV